MLYKPFLSNIKIQIRNFHSKPCTWKRNCDFTATCEIWCKRWCKFIN